MKFINKNKVTMAQILEPIEGKSFSFGQSTPHGWQVVFFFGHTTDGDYVKEYIDRDSEADCRKLIEQFNLIEI